jgi:hypothetical protein
LFVFNDLTPLSFRRLRALFVFNDLAPFSFRRATAKLTPSNGAEPCGSHVSRSGEAHKVTAISAAPCPRRQSQVARESASRLSVFPKNNTSRRPAWQEIVGFLDRAPDLYQNTVEYGLTFARLTHAHRGREGWDRGLSKVSP